MKTLFLVRHAKSSWSDAGLSDRDRPLNDRGERDVHQMGKRLAARGVKPDRVVSSPAVRALATAKVIAGALDVGRKDIVVDERVYEASVDDLLGVIRELGGHPRCVVLVGHNPGMTELAQRFSREIGTLPTCAVAEFTFDAQAWSEIGALEPRDVAFLRPDKSTG